jgi:hypothetical protein
VHQKNDHGTLQAATNAIREVQDTQGAHATQETCLHQHTKNPENARPKNRTRKPNPPSHKLQWEGEKKKQEYNKLQEEKEKQKKQQPK